MCVQFLVVSYVLHLGWLALSCLLLLPVLYWLMFESVCEHELFLPYRLAQAHSSDAALNFTRAFRYFFNITRYGTIHTVYYSVYLTLHCTTL